MNDRIPVLKTYKIFINGEFPRSESGRTYTVKDSRGRAVANICQSSRKDFRNSVVAARAAQPGWARRSGYNRGQILYRLGELVEGRREQFVSELKQQGSSLTEARKEVNLTVDRLVYFAGWADKFQQLFSAVNPVGSPHFVFSVPEPTGVVALIAPERSGLLGLVSLLSPIILGGNTVVALVSETKPMCAITFSEVLSAGDVPPGVINLLTGFRSELLEQISGHMDVNAIVYAGEKPEELALIQRQASLNVKRVISPKAALWTSEHALSPYLIMETQEVKTTWHPIGL
jgi:acyl-CoA reductase-like NAD-dependent aldehyde dehydrogenase